MSKVKVRLADNIARVIFIEKDATVGATLGTNLFLPDGAVATPETLRTYLNVTAGGDDAGVRDHRLLRGLVLGDDHPQYTRKDTLTTRGDLYMRNATTVTRLPLGPVDQILRSDGTDADWYDADANPTAQVGLTAVPGTANTFIRSDGAPALSQAITPTWTGNHIFLSTSVLFGTATPISTAGSSGRWQMFGNTSTILSVTRATNDTAGFGIVFAKTRSTTPDGLTIVQNGDALGSFVWAAADGIDLNSFAGRFRVLIDGVPGADSVPGRMTFETTSSGASTPIERFRISSFGGWGIAGANFGTAGQLFTSGGAAAAPAWQTFQIPDGTAAAPGLAFTNSATTGIYRAAADTFGLATAGVQAVLLDSSGRLLVSATASAALTFMESRVPSVQVLGPNNSTSTVVAARYNASAGGSSLQLVHSRGTTVGSNTILQNGDIMGSVDFGGADGTNMVFGAQVRAQVDGTPALADMPTRIVFLTTPAASVTPTERVRINAGGQILISDGTAALPGFGFINDPNTGVYRLAADQIGISANGTLCVDVTTVRAKFAMPVRLQGYTVATLPAGAAGDVAYVTDALAPAFLAAVAGGGAVVCTVFHNGAAWVVQ